MFMYTNALNVRSSKLLKFMHQQYWPQKSTTFQMRHVLKPHPVELPSWDWEQVTIAALYLFIIPDFHIRLSPSRDMNLISVRLHPTTSIDEPMQPSGGGGQSRLNNKPNKVPHFFRQRWEGCTHLWTVSALQSNGAVWGSFPCRCCCLVRLCEMGEDEWGHLEFQDRNGWGQFLFQKASLLPSGR